MRLINCKINLILIWSANCVITDAVIQATTFATADIKLYVPIITLSAQDNTKLLQYWKSGFKRTINCHQYQLILLKERQKQYLDYLIDPAFKGVNRLLFYCLKIMSIEQNTQYIFFHIQKENITIS